MKKENLVSIIIPVYNAEKYLKRCLESVISQTWENLEILILDDGSVDESLSISRVYEMNDDRITVISKNNTGVSDTREIGIQKATGDWLAFLDSDDWYDKNFIRTLLYSCLENNTDISACQYYIVHGNNICLGAKTKIGTILNQEEAIYQVLLGKPSEMCPAIWNKLYKMELVKKTNIHFNKRLHLGEDELWLIQILKYCNRVSCVKNALYYYWTQESSLCHGRISEKKISNIESKRIIIQETSTLSYRLKKKAEGRYYSECIYLFLLSREKSDLQFICKKIDWDNWKKYKESYFAYDDSSFIKRTFLLFVEYLARKNIWWAIYILSRSREIWQRIKWKIWHKE